MQYKKIISVILSVAFVFSLIGGTSTSYASTASLNDKKDKIQDKIDEAQSKIDALAGQKKETKEYISALDVKIQAVVSMFGRETSVDFELDQLEKVKD